MKKHNALWLAASLFLILGCSLFTAPATPSSDLLATLQASTPSGYAAPAGAGDTPTAPVFNAYTPVATPTTNPANPDSVATSIPSPSASDQPGGHIVFTCQVFRVTAMNQICIMNADGTGYRRLTTEDNLQHFYPSLSPDGQSVLYAGFREQNVYEIYKLDLADGSVDRLTNKIGISTSPEYSPDGQEIVFTRSNPRTNEFQLMVMDPDGNNLENIPQVNGWDPTWSPDGKRILFASDRDGATQLFTVNLTGGATARSTSRSRWQVSPWCSVPATSTPPNVTKAWWRPSPSNRWSS